MRTLRMTLCASLLLGCGVQGNGVVAEEERALGALDAVVNASSLVVTAEVRAGADPRARVTCDENLIPHIETRLEGRRLIVSAAPGVWLQPRARCEVHVVAPAIDEAEIAGSGALRVWSAEPEVGMRLARVAGSGSLEVDAPVSGAALALRVDGSGDLEVREARPEHLDVEVAGSGSVRALRGESRSVTVAIRGSGDADVSAVPAAEVEAIIEGSGSARVHCTGRLEARVDGSGSVFVRGDPPERDERGDGSGDVRYAP